ncbi:DNA topoisomerase IB [Ornithinimicrobium pekingense]|uniref:DNA topoisomerase n=1 Tax=Ornithinimicrobium pekingense TaxID=384677 RepID=A0ABQ2FA02_9MICO|nr:DNA topoisomerase IB [Ornithinimicrobium pekingense]GGK73160.1 DNA topoisomerase [Ornithinimicrobium pekingense]
MVRLRRVSPDEAGWTRRRAGKGFSYRDEEGAKLPAEDVERIRSLAIPPAWRDVWICPRANGHIQAVGTDDAGRRQYLYHPDWRARQDELKFERIVEASRLLPAARKRVSRDLRREGMPWERACATAVRMLDKGYFRIGHDVYTDVNGSFGLTTLERQHVRSVRGGLRFCFVGKSGVEQELTIEDEDVTAALRQMRRRRTASQRVLAYRDGRGWHDLDADDVNTYLGDLFDGQLTAKDFRTWHATVHAAVALASSPEPGDTVTSRRRAVRAAVEEVSEFLGNTPTIAKGSYIDPRVIEQYEEGETVTVPAAKEGRTPVRRQGAVEEAVRELLGAEEGD